ncbi:MAG TPA: hypothetical protein EYP08_05555 [Pyrodictiaceae archaeon]|nr:hypothetical protein [Pyrodictiaceae archaeon]
MFFKHLGEHRYQRRLCFSRTCGGDKEYVKIPGTENLYTVRFKESDRLEAILDLLRQAGVNANYTRGCIVVEGLCGSKKKFSRLSPVPDHRIVMMASLLAALANGQVEISNAEAVKKSYPQYWSHLKLLNNVELNTG